MGQIIAIDFDGTLCEHAWPQIGEEKPKMLALAKELRAKGALLILWTCRENEALDEALAWCYERGLEFDAVNCNVEEWPGNGSDQATRKIYADLYIDDRAVSPERAAEGILGLNEPMMKNF